MVLDLLRAEKIMVVHGTGFNWPEPDHFRIVTLPRAEDLTDAVDPDRPLPRRLLPAVGTGCRATSRYVPAAGEPGAGRPAGGPTERPSRARRCRARTGPAPARGGA